jgi:putative transposase
MSKACWRATNERVQFADVGMFEFWRQLEYKAAMRGWHLGVADRFFPSSKRCSACGHVNLALNRGPEWMCPACGVIDDRDMNASMNLELVAVSSLDASGLPAFAGRTVTVGRKVLTASLRWP